MGTIGKLRKLNKYCFRGWYDNYLFEYAVDISAHMNTVAFLSNQEDLEKEINANKIVDVECGRLYVNSDNKTFAWYEGIDYTQSILNILQEGNIYPEDIIEAFENGIFPRELQDIFTVPKVRILPFSHLTKVQFVDKTTVDENRTYTMESNAGNAMLGAIVGSMFDRTVFDNNAITGAMIGASGARRITEKVDRTVNTAFDVILYFNDINNLSHTIRFYNESDLREFIAVLEYIMNNKESSTGEVKEIELKKNELEVRELSSITQCKSKRVNKLKYGILALFLGVLGAHHFYAGKTEKGILYLLLSCTGISCILVFIDIIKILLKPANELGEIEVD